MSHTPVWFTSPRHLSFGLMMPVREGTMGGETPRFPDLVEMALLAREVGFEALWFGDHLSYQHGDETVGTWEAFTLISAILNAVPDIHAGTLVAGAGFRNPGLVARMAETIDEVSDGRFILGLGAGWNKLEYEQFGYPFDHRASRFEEGVEIIHSMLRQGESTLDGRFWQAKSAPNGLHGPSNGDIPILIGSNGERLAATIARFADAWNSDWQGSPQDYLPLLARLDAACDAIDRPRESLIRTGSARFGPDSRDDDIFAYLQGALDLGLRHLVIGLEPRTTATIRWFGEKLASFDANCFNLG